MDNAEQAIELIDTKGAAKDVFHQENAKRSSMVYLDDDDDAKDVFHQENAKRSSMVYLDDDDDDDDTMKLNVVRRRNKNAEAKNEIDETSTINVVVSNHKKNGKAIDFPVSSSHVGCCACVKRLCCHGLTDTDDLILRQERERLDKHLDKEDEILDGKDNCMMLFGEASLFLFKVPKCCDTCCQHPTMKWTYFVLQMLIISSFFLFSLILPLSFRASCANSPTMYSTSAGNFYCSPVQDQLRHSQYTKNITGYAGVFIFFIFFLFFPLLYHIH